MGYNSVADNAGVSSLLLPPKDDKCREIPENLTLQRSSKVIDLGVNEKPICESH